MLWIVAQVLGWLPWENILLAAALCSLFAKVLQVALADEPPPKAAAPPPPADSAR